MTIYTELSRIQKELKAPKGQFNKFGGYKYRSCEDIMEAVKPILNDCCLTVTDDIILVGDRYYIKATARLAISADEFIENSALAREEEVKKGMDGSQITGSASSYARKYALNGLFAIDDTKDADATNTHGKEKTANQDEPTASPLAKKYKTTDFELVAKLEKKVAKSIEALKTMTEFLTQEQNNKIWEIVTDSRNAGVKKELVDELDKARANHLEPLDDFIPHQDVRI